MMRYLCSVISDSFQPHGLAHQAPVSMDFSRQGYWSGVPFLSPGDLCDPGIEPRSLVSPAIAYGFLTMSIPSLLNFHFWSRHFCFFFTLSQSRFYLCPLSYSMNLFHLVFQRQLKPISFFFSFRKPSSVYFSTLTYINLPPLPISCIFKYFFLFFPLQLALGFFHYFCLGQQKG